MKNVKITVMPRPDNSFSILIKSSSAKETEEAFRELTAKLKRKLHVPEYNKKHLDATVGNYTVGSYELGKKEAYMGSVKALAMIQLGMLTIPKQFK